MAPPSHCLVVTLPAQPARSYEVVVGTDLLPAAGDLALARHPAGTPEGWLLVTDQRVGALYAATVARALAARGAQVVQLEVAAGEASKSRDTVGRLQDAAIASGAGRDWALAALGGGVAGDLGGFVAATLFRGIPLLMLPTSLLAMVDSSVGGKTGVDTPAGKNLVGAFHQPFAVLADVGTLVSLPEAELRSGLAEVIKYGVIGDAELLADLEAGALDACLAREADALQGVVARCVRQKAVVVAADERESGCREILNFGHTVGHAVELLSEYKVRHGEAVAIGMVVEASLAARRGAGDPGLPRRLASLLRRAGLPVSLPPGIAPHDVVSAARHDKKARRGAIRCALPRGVGDAAGSGATAVSDEELLAALRAAC